MARKKKAGGGVTVADDPSPDETYEGKGSKVEKEAKERKRGGRADHKVEGASAKKRFDRPGRKLGGRVGCEKAPLSGASRTSMPEGRSADDGLAGT